MEQYKYIGISCPVCHQPFTDQDDVVVCPICGAPHHRACYQKLGHCAYEEHHAEGRDWQPPKREPKEAFEDGTPHRCPNCGTVNPPDGIFCQICGTRLNQQPDAPQGGMGGQSQPRGYQYGMPGQGQGQGQSQSGPPPIGPNPFTTPYGGLAPDEDLDGVTAREMALFVGENSFYFLPRFKRFFREHRSWDWNWPALIFNCFYFLYRKMYALGIGLIVLSLIFSIPSILLVTQYSDYYVALLTTVNPPAPDAGMEELVMIANVTRVISFAVSVTVAALANKLYYRHALRCIKQLRGQFEDYEFNTDYSLALSKKGRTNKKLIMIICISIIALNLISSFALAFLTILS